MKITLDGILVVEGKEDASYLSNYVASEIVMINGFEISEATIKYLNNKKVIVLTDPDAAGQKIRERINNLLPNVINAEVDISKCSRGNKNGIAECEIDEILTKLKQYIIEEKASQSDIKMSDLYNLNLVGNQSLRKHVCDKLNFGECNAKTLYKRLIANNIKLKELIEIVK